MRQRVEMDDHEYPVYPLYREPEDVLYDLLEEIIELLDKE